MDHRVKRRLDGGRDSTSFGLPPIIALCSGGEQSKEEGPHSRTLGGEGKCGSS